MQRKFFAMREDVFFKVMPKMVTCILLFTIFRTWLFNLIYLYWSSDNVGQETLDKLLGQQVQMSFYTICGVISLMLIYYLCSSLTTKKYRISQEECNEWKTADMKEFYYFSYRKRLEICNFALSHQFPWSALISFKAMFPSQDESSYPLLVRMNLIMPRCCLILSSYIFLLMFIRHFKDPDMVSSVTEAHTFFNF